MEKKLSVFLVIISLLYIDSYVVCLPNRNSRVVVDDYSLALSNGLLNVTHQLEKLDANQNFFEIGNLLSSQTSRCSNQEITLFANVGLAFQDLVACSIIYDNALKVGGGNWVTIYSVCICSQNLSITHHFC